MNPRIRIHKDRRATLSGVNYRDLRWILSAASVSYHDRLKEMRREKADPEHIAEVENQLKVMQLLHASMDEAIQATYPPPPPPTKRSRRALVEHERRERELIDGLLEAALKNRRSA